MIKSCGDKIYEIFNSESIVLTLTSVYGSEIMEAYYGVYISRLENAPTRLPT